MAKRSSSTKLVSLGDALERLLASPERAGARDDVEIRIGSSTGLRLDRLALFLGPRGPSKDYDDKLRSAEQYATVGGRVAPLLGALGPRADVAIPRLLEALREPLVGSCRPECCSASLVRREQIRMRLAVLQALRRIRVDVGVLMDAGLVGALLDRSSSKIALGAMDLLAQSASGVRLHREAIVGALEHPRPLVVEGRCARSVASIRTTCPMHSRPSRSRWRTSRCVCGERRSAP
ncbi:hypothetical protein AKJ09_04930 [Labilithrix luteola]|uniref:Uncharacterized protein n=1 Tax=Labilithrix luteola TaxID=1391654 RepID=A0A0K1PY22_9BACT|nr:hypothetical protein [Labilithrix luteola]AKU98266.1 hypothetical protein AKJ09_04930 [Labilithrix luteola]